MTTSTRRSFIKGSLAALVGASVNPFGQTNAALAALVQTTARPWEQQMRDRFVGETKFRAVNMPNCTGSCGWNVFQKDGIVQRVEPPLDYPDDEYNPRGCMKGQTYHRRVYAADRVKYPMKRVGARGAGIWERLSWDEAFDYIAAEIKRISEKYGSNTVWLYPPVPATGIIKQGAGVRFASVNSFGIGTFFNWYGDLPLAHPMTWNVKSEEHEFRDVLNSKYAIIWGSDVFQTRMPDAHFFTDIRAKGVKLVYISPYFDPTASGVDEWVKLRPGTDAALALGMCHVIVKKGLTDEAHLRRTTSGPLLIREDNSKYLKASDVDPDGDPKTFMVYDSKSEAPVPDVYFSDEPPLTGSWSVKLANGETITCSTSHTLFLKTIDEHDPETVSEITGVPTEVIERIAVEYASADPASIWAGTGINHWYHGDLMGRCTIALGCMTGNIGKPGGGVGPWSGQHKVRLNPTEYFFPKKTEGGSERYRPLPLDTTYVVQGPTETMAEKEKYWRQVRCIWAAGGNLFGQASDQAQLAKTLDEEIEFIVSPEVQMSSTAQLADIVLPIVSWYELPMDLCTTPAHPYIQLHEGALKPMYEAKTDLEVYYEISKRLGTGDIFEYNDPEQVADLLLRTGGSQVEGITLDRMKKERVVKVNMLSDTYVPFTEQVAGKATFATASGRQELYKDEDRFIEYGEQLPIHKEPHVASPYGTSKVWSEAKKERNPNMQAYPLVYHARHTRWSVHSSWRTTDILLKLDDIGQPLLEMNREEAAKRDLVAGEYAIAYNQHGYIKAKVKIRDSVPTGAVLIYFGWQRQQIREGHWNGLSRVDINPIHEIYFKPNFWGPVSGHFDQICEVKKA
jgi:anaerobic selenocysteine-containing dehydrogenase